MRSELLRQPFVRDVGLGDDQQARRVLVDAVDDARPRDPADPGQRSAAMVEQSVDQGPVEIPRGGVHDQPCGLVDDQQMLVLEDDLERNFLRRIVRRRRFGHLDAQALAAVDLDCRVANRFALRFDGAVADQRLQPLARHRRHGIGERTVEAPAGMGGRQANVDRLNTPHGANMGLELWLFNGGTIGGTCAMLNSGPSTAR